MCLSCSSLIKSSGSLATSTCECECVCGCVSRGVVNVIENHCPYVDKERQRGLVGAWAGCFLFFFFFVASCLPSCFLWRKCKQRKLLLRQEPVSMLHCREKKRQKGGGGGGNRERKQENRNKTQHVSPKRSCSFS